METWSSQSIYTEAAQNQETVWSCDEYDVGVYDDEWGSFRVIDDCGDIEGTYSGTADYNVFISGIQQELDLMLVNSISVFPMFSVKLELLGFHEYRHHGISMSDEVFEVDLGDGEVVNAVVNPVLQETHVFVMIGNAIAYSSESFRPLLRLRSRNRVHWVKYGDIFGGGKEECDDSSDMWMCDNGEMIYEWYVNDGEGCMDGSDEDSLQRLKMELHRWIYGISGLLNHSLGYAFSNMCQNTGRLQD